MVDEAAAAIGDTDRFVARVAARVEVRDFLHRAVKARLAEYTTTLSEDEALLDQWGSDRIGSADGSGSHGGIQPSTWSWRRSSMDPRYCAVLLRSAEKHILRQWASTLVGKRAEPQKEEL